MDRNKFLDSTTSAAVLCCHAIDVDQRKEDIQEGRIILFSVQLKAPKYLNNEPSPDSSELGQRQLDDFASQPRVSFLPFR